MKTFKPKFNTGDVVRQRDGRGPPRMTVIACGSIRVVCEWFEGRHREEGVFVAAELQRVVGNSGVVPA